ncbi:SH2 domain-containing protein 6 isoform X2 [Sminthopsis crassicaudata]|uniref:SH2 domain-containing protein 6 isoform X2 n=1 Tax=Sminthopsis crassicaudata TaxID=9301 RepID=UPI003D682D74
MQISGTMGSLFALILPALKRSGCGSGSHWLLSPLMDKIGGNRTPSQAPLPPPRAPGKLPRGAARAAPQSWREDALTPSSPAAPGPLGQWVTSSDSYSAPSLALGPDLGPPPVPPLPPAFRPPGSRGLSLQDREEEEDGEGEYELPPCESLAARMAPFLGEKSALYLDRSVTSGPPKPVPRASRLLRAPSLQEAGGRGDRLGRRGLAAAGSSDPAEEDSEEAIYLEPTLVSPLNQDLGPQAPSPPAVIPRATMAPRSAYKALSVSQEAWSGSGDIAHNVPPDLLLPGGRSAFTGNPAAEEKAALLTQPWYSAHCDRQTAENALLSLQKDGSYTVRPSSDPRGLQPFTLAVFFRGHVYNIPIRWLEARRQYALGRESRSSDKLFPTVAAMVQHFSQHPLLLVNRLGGARQHTCLLFPARP